MTKKESFKLLKQYIINEKRLQHCLDTQKTAIKLAKRYGVDQEKASIAGLLHDIGKNLDTEIQKKLIKECDIKVGEYEKDNLEILHGRFGAELLKNNGIKDKEILKAVISHTIPEKDMSTLAKIIYLADIIEPNRSFKGLGKLRKLCKKDLNQAMLYSIKLSITSLVEKGKAIHPNSIKVYNELIS